MQKNDKQMQGKHVMLKIEAEGKDVVFLTSFSPSDLLLRLFRSRSSSPPSKHVMLKIEVEEDKKGKEVVFLRQIFY